ncbi:MAG TPA: TonB-dependent receptor [Vicinamibacterales bacterium]|nr:TonB-dependent receptor [Vicinamibacterales bacterium]
MVRRIAASFAVVALCFAAAAGAQQQTGEIFGHVNDNTGAVLPGVTVTLTGESLIQPLTATTSANGTYQFPRIPIGTYTVRFELPGFKTLVREGIRVTVGFSAEVSQQLELSTVQETVTVTGESPVVDTRETGAKTTFDLETLQNIPSARDPWVMLERTPGITMDRVNVGGTQSGQQSGYVSRGSGSGNNKWSIDGVDVTDMSATGASPIYYDFDMLQEMQVTTGGADASQQTGGVGINFVTRGGTDRFRGTGRLYITDEKFQDDNLTDEVKRGGVGGGAPIQSVKDYGFEVGGPIMRGRLWYWGSYGKQDVKAGIPGFFLPDANCQAMKATLAADPLAPIATKDVRSCLGTDGTKLNNYNWKINWAPFQGNRFAFQNTWAEKFKNARDASDTRPIETTFRQRAVSSDFGRFGWDVGPSPLWKASDQHVISDRWLIDLQWSHLGNNFVLDFHEDDLASVQRRLDVNTGIWSESYQRSGPFIRPTHSFDVTTSYFLPAVAGGDHSLKAGFRWRSAKEHSESNVGGNTTRRFIGGVAREAELHRDSITNYYLSTYAAYVQDTYTVNRLTFNLGVRWDRQANEALASSVPEHPFLADWLPAISFGGAESPVVWNDVSPRLGLTYDVRGDARTVAKASFALYYGQRSPNQAVSPLNPVTAASIRFPWNDANGDTMVQRNELTLGRSNVLFFSGNYNPDNPSALTTTGSVDGGLKNDRTREVIVGLQHELARNIGVEANYINRKYDRFAWNDTLGFTSADFVARQFTPSAASCPAADARCETVTVYDPAFPIPAPYIYTNQPDRWRDYNGVELTLTKRLADRWMGLISFAYNDALDHWDSPDAYEDPTCRAGGGAPDSQAMCIQQQFAPESGGSGIDNVFTNAKWLFKLQGMYTLPLNINVAGFYQTRQGYPFPQAVRVASRPNRGGTVDVLLDPVGEVRHPNLHYADFKVERAFAFGTARVTPSLDIFNVGNVNTVLARRRLQAASNANRISGIVAPRVIRFGVRVSW